MVVRCSGRGLGAGGLLLSVGWSLRKVVALVGVSVCGGVPRPGCPGWLWSPCRGGVRTQAWLVLGAL